MLSSVRSPPPTSQAEERSVSDDMRLRSTILHPPLGITAEDWKNGARLNLLKQLELEKKISDDDHRELVANPSAWLASATALRDTRKMEPESVKLLAVALGEGAVDGAKDGPVEHEDAGRPKPDGGKDDPEDFVEDEAPDSAEDEPDDSKDKEDGDEEEDDEEEGDEEEEDARPTTSTTKIGKSAGKKPAGKTPAGKTTAGAGTKGKTRKRLYGDNEEDDNNEDGDEDDGDGKAINRISNPEVWESSKNSFGKRKNGAVIKYPTPSESDKGSAVLSSLSATYWLSSAASLWPPHVHFPSTDPCILHSRGVSTEASLGIPF
ncbi:hypothetical protein Dda_6924 [Drechslerella dactyloides]|uniref:Uncharacterized protein n=1 Tax=Drechslerella dactyloides TaxID=74499 RepID=A0AAD6IX59_DREDA|nr:hypothetical protein Dda_6924 [Drechslerella dactyloides]